MNILIYPLYLIGNNKDHFERHEEIVNINIEVVKSFNCVDDIRIVGKPVVNWSEMINDLMKQVEGLLKEGNNVLVCEADNFIVEEFSDIFSLTKFTLFALCNNGSNLDNNLPGGEYLNSGLCYYPQTDYQSYFNYSDILETDSSMTSLEYEKNINHMFYSQFNTHEDGLDFINTQIGFSVHNWRGLLSIDIDDRFKYKAMPTSKNIKSIHFLNLSQYIHNIEGFDAFWYKKFVLSFKNGQKKKLIVLRILFHYWSYVKIPQYERKYRLVKYFVKVLINK